MTKEEKEHKLKLISLIMMVNFVKFQKERPESIRETLAFGWEQVFWTRELARTIKTKTFEKGCVVTNSNENPEMIITKNGIYPMPKNLPKDTKNK